MNCWVDNVGDDGSGEEKDVFLVHVRTWEDIRGGVQETVVTVVEQIFCEFSVCGIEHPDDEPSDKARLSNCTDSVVAVVSDSI